MEGGNKADVEGLGFVSLCGYGPRGVRKHHTKYKIVKIVVWPVTVQDVFFLKPVGWLGAAKGSQRLQMGIYLRTECHSTCFCLACIELIRNDKNWFPSFKPWNIPSLGIQCFFFFF